MDQLTFSLELAKFDEKEALAELEVKKAGVRQAEVKYEKCRFVLDWTAAIVKEEKTRKVPTGPVLS